MRLSSCSSAELAIQSLLLSAEGDDLSELKCIMDGFGDIHSMHKLVFQDLSDLNIRDRVLNHFLHEGTSQVAQRALMSSGHFRELLQWGKRYSCIPKNLAFFRDSDRDTSPNSLAQAAECPSYDGRRGGHSWLKI